MRRARSSGGFGRFAGIAVSALLGVAACTIAALPKGDGACSARGKCANDPPPTADEIDACNRALAGPCASAYRALLDCVTRAQTCTKDGLTDATAVRAACANEDASYTSCVPAPKTAGTLDASAHGD